MFLNYGDKYTGGGNGGGGKQDTNKGSAGATTANVNNLAQSNLIGLAWRLALALQADGWILRSDIIWAKAVSFCEIYCGSTMPESVNGWRWERHRVTRCPNCGTLSSFEKQKCKKCGYQKPKTRTAVGEIEGFRKHSGYEIKEEVQRVDCPGCPKCKPNDGYVLRKGSWRPTRAHEYLFQFVKSPNYFCDMDAVKEAQSGNTLNHAPRKTGIKHLTQIDGNKPTISAGGQDVSGRNLRDVWTINPQAFPEAHYATFPEKLVEPCIKVATSEKGCCPKCGSQWTRVVDKEQVKRNRPEDKTDRHNQGNGVNSCGNTVAGVNTTTLGWRPTCTCGKEPVPCTVFDPFFGAGTVGLVAYKLNRNYIGTELSKEYIEMAEKRIGAEKDKYCLLEA